MLLELKINRANKIRIFHFGNRSPYFYDRKEFSITKKIRIGATLLEHNKINRANNVKFKAF